MAYKPDMLQALQQRQSPFPNCSTAWQQALKSMPSSAYLACTARVACCSRTLCRSLALRCRAPPPPLLTGAQLVCKGREG
eukprot:1155306-Pelagomonas_calceolata.AAC.4